MRRIAFLSVTLLVGIWLHMIIHRHLGTWGAPHVLLLLALAVGWYQGPVVGELTGFLSGAIADAWSLAPFGSQTALLTIAGYLAGMGRGRLDETSLVAQASLAVAMSIGYLLGMILIVQVVPGMAHEGIGREVERQMVWRWGSRAWGQPFFDGLAALPVFWGMRGWTRWWRLPLNIHRVAGT